MFFYSSFLFIRSECAIMQYISIISNNLLVLGLLMSKCHNFCRKNFTCTFIEWKKIITKQANSNLLLLCPLFVVHIGELMVGCTAFAIIVIYPERQNSNNLIKLIYCFNKFQNYMENAGFNFWWFHLIYLLYISNPSTTTKPLKLKLDSSSEATENLTDSITNQKS